MFVEYLIMMNNFLMIYMVAALFRRGLNDNVSEAPEPYFASMEADIEKAGKTQGCIAR